MKTITQYLLYASGWNELVDFRMRYPTFSPYLNSKFIIRKRSLWLAFSNVCGWTRINTMHLEWWGRAFEQETELWFRRVASFNDKLYSVNFSIEIVWSHRKLLWNCIKWLKVYLATYMRKKLGSVFYLLSIQRWSQPASFDLLWLLACKNGCGGQANNFETFLSELR